MIAGPNAEGISGFVQVSESMVIFADRVILFETLG